MALCAEVCLKYGRCSGKCLNPHSILYGESVITVCRAVITHDCAPENVVEARDSVQELVYRMRENKNFTLTSKEAADVFQLLVDIHKELC